VEFRLLGPLEVLRDGRPVSLGGRKPRAVLAILLLHANEVVSADRLIDALWGESPPGAAGNTLQAHVSQLRKALGGKDGTASNGRIRTQRPGYVIHVHPEELDLARFEHLVESGRRALAGRELDVAAGLLREALGLWRGPPLAEFAYEPFAEHEIARLQELRLVALEERIEADLAAGSHRRLVPELEQLTAEHPLRERLRGQLILALYRAGRQADALRVYQETRRALVDELGIEPSPALQQLERAILIQDPGLEAKPPMPDRTTLPPLVRPGERPREVRKTVTILQASLVPSAYGDGAPDPEAVHLVAARGRDAAVRVLEQRGASVARTSGDVVVAYFGTPVVKEDDVLRALTAALELRGEVGSDGDRAGGPQIEVSVGVVTGEVVAIEQEGEQPHIIGEPARLAARLEQAASPGEILIGEETRRLAREATLVEPTAPLPVKGRRQPVPAWRLLEVLAGAEPIRRRLETPMLGREDELETLRQAFERAVLGREAVLVTIVGAAGIGKSRLARELREHLEDEATVLMGHCLSYGEGITYWPLAEIVRQAAGEPERVAELLPGDPEARLVADRLTAAFGGGELGGSREETFWAARTFLEGIARGRPVVVVVDDLHWAEATFLDLLGHVADFASNAPILLVCLSRPELIGDRPEWFDGKPNTVSLELGPLSDRDSEQLIDGMLGTITLTADARRRVADAAEGNPLFLEQVLTMLIHERSLEAAVQERAELDAFSIPPTIHALLAARLDRLAGEERRLLESGAIVGRVFWREALETLSGGGKDGVAASLEGLVRKQLIQPDKAPFGAEEGYSFRHGLIQETAYLAIPKGERARLHVLFGDWLEDAGGRLAAEYEEIVGYHLEQAYRCRTELGATAESQRAVAERAALHLAGAGRRSYARGDLPAAVNLLARAVSLMPDDDPGRLEHLVDLGEALREIGDLDWARSVLEEALSSASARENRVTASHARIVLRRIEGHLSEAAIHALVEDAERAIGVFEPAGDERGLGKAWHLLGYGALVKCRAGTAEAAARRAVEHARRAGDNRTEAHGLGLLAACSLFSPTPVAEGLRTWEGILAEPPAQRRVLATACRALGGLNAMVGRFDEAREYCARDKELLAELGLRISAAAAAEVYGAVEQLAGNLERAAEEFVRGYQAFHELGERSGLSTLASHAAHTHCDLRRYDEARRLSVLAEDNASPEDLSTQMLWRAARARCAAAAGELDEAERLAREGVAVAERTDFIVMHAGTLESLAEVLLARGDQVGATGAIRSALELYERKGNLVAAERTRAALLSLTPSATYP
jgi:DNA-binding SARP family transcriptional activator/class 3 adenylate cyclase/tetratricopeptide (TPR) repeat protein